MLKLRLGPWRYEIVQGGRIKVGDCRLRPIVGICSFTRRRATIREDGTSALGMQWARITPLAVISERPGERRLLPIINWSRVLGWGLVALCVAAFLAARRSTR